MQIRREFQEFIGHGKWGKQKEFYAPSMEEVQAGAFQLPLTTRDQGALSQTHLDLLNIGHNVEGFNALDETTRTGAQQILERKGTWGEVHDLPQGKLAAIHMTNVAEAHNHLVRNVVGSGFGVFQAMQALGKQMFGDEEKLVSIGVGQGSVDCIAADVYPVHDVTYMGQTMRGITQDPIGRVYVDLTNGTAFMMPDDKFHGRS